MTERVQALYSLLRAIEARGKFPGAPVTRERRGRPGGMSAPSAANGAWRGTLRRVLRAVDAHVTPHTGSQTWRDHVLAEFRSNRDTMALADRVAARLRAADEWAKLANAVQRHKAMIMDYGHSLEKEREQLKKASNTANYVGLSMPDAYDHATHDLAAANKKKGGDE